MLYNFGRYHNRCKNVLHSCIVLSSGKDIILNGSFSDLARISIHITLNIPPGLYWLEKNANNFFIRLNVLIYVFLLENYG